MQIGIDIEETSRFRSFTSTSSFIKRFFSKREIQYCFTKHCPHIHLAARFAAKEAFFKATQKGISYPKIEILNNLTGIPEIFILGKRNNKLSVSISHSRHYAVAVVLSEN